MSSLLRLLKGSRESSRMIFGRVNPKELLTRSPKMDALLSVVTKEIKKELDTLTPQQRKLALLRMDLERELLVTGNIDIKKRLKEMKDE